MTFGDVLEVGNGVWAVLAGWLTAFMIYHVLVIRVQRGIDWHRLFFNFNLPLSMQMALGMLAVAFAVFLTRLVLWWARYLHSGDIDLLMPQNVFYLSGTLLGIVGFLCIIRTVSHPTLGHWPWVCALVSSMAYLAWWSIKFT
jgi:hypothetical protein